MVGDVNSTVACALVAVKEGIRVAHIEAGLRSFDRTMPEEINRVLTDSISDFMSVSEPSGIANLAREGRPIDKIFLVGNVMIDTLLRMRPKASGLCTYSQFGMKAGQYAYLTLHRPSNVDHDDILAEICNQMIWLTTKLPVIFPVHPRTKNRLKISGLSARFEALPNLHMIEPVSYLESLSLTVNARVVITDSGGLQEESSALGIPCLTLRENTERPITVSEGTNTLMGCDWTIFKQCIQRIENGSYLRNISPIPYWDGQAGKRILNILIGIDRMEDGDVCENSKNVGNYI